MTDESESKWCGPSEEVLSGMKEWRQAHAGATLREIEEAVIERMSRLTARLIQDLALSSATTEWSSQPLADRPRCPHCGAGLFPPG